MTTDPEVPQPRSERSRWYGIWLPRAAALTVVIVAVFYTATWLFGNTSSFLVLLLVAAFVAFALLPAVEKLTQIGWRRGPATAVVMLVGTLIAAAFVYAMTRVVIAQVLSLVENAPDYLESVNTWLNDRFGIDINIDRAVEELTSSREQLGAVAANAAGGLLGLASTALGLVFQGLTIGLFVFYILADLPKLRTSVMRRFPPARQLHIDTVISITIEKVGGYVYSRLLLSLASAVFHTVAFMLIGLDYAVALGLWVGVVSQFIPTVGTYLAGAFPVLIALVSNPIDALWVVGIIAAYQQVENYLLAPRVTANTMDLHPAVAFGSVIVGASLLGGTGALLALPAAATVVALIQTYTVHYEVVTEDEVESPEEYAARVRARTVKQPPQRRQRRTRKPPQE